MKEQLILDIKNNRFLEARRKIDEILLLSTANKSSVNYIVEKAILYMKDCYPENLSLSRVATQVGVTPNYLSKMFVEHVGVNFSTYLNFIRIKKAEGLLLDTEFSIAQIAEEVGYADSAYFIRVFRQYTRCTPTQFRYFYYRYQKSF